jgi:hypothetical protein
MGARPQARQQIAIKAKADRITHLLPVSRFLDFLASPALIWVKRAPVCSALEAVGFPLIPSNL